MNCHPDRRPAPFAGPPSLSSRPERPDSFLPRRFSARRAARRDVCAPCAAPHQICHPDRSGPTLLLRAAFRRVGPRSGGIVATSHPPRAPPTLSLFHSFIFHSFTPNLCPLPRPPAQVFSSLHCFIASSLPRPQSAATARPFAHSRIALISSARVTLSGCVA